MAKPSPTRTIGPLHFEDLEPHRFEDLIRQLAYDFRAWKQLEASGRSGSDDGFDARGVEQNPDADDGSADAEPGDQELEGGAPREERIWLIQCKREKKITPKKLKEYLDAILADEASQLYGIIFAAATDFSKLARDLFRAKTREMGIGEAYLWGKGEIEDMLFQPKNDGLLFSYFGISLRIRQRSLQTDLRSRLATKRKVKKILEYPGIDFLVRDASDNRYPFLDGDVQKERICRGRWYVYSFDEARHDGVHILFRRQLAYVDDDGIKWDYAEKMNDAYPQNDPWRTEEDRKTREARDIARQEAFSIWEKLPASNRAWATRFLILPYENILAIDERGDEIFDGPHLYTIQFTRLRGPFSDYERFELTAGGQWDARGGVPKRETRIEIFPRDEAHTVADP
jgi:hypothetical protein